MDNQWMYIDFNSYFASVEQQLDPTLRGKPVAVVPVLSDATSAIAASYEAKKHDVKTGTPIWEAKKMCPGLVCVLANHEAYVHFHHKILKEIERHVPIAKVCSIDEVACELMDNERAQAEELAKRIKRGLKENVGECITCSIGFAPNSYLAKVATDMKKPDGLIFIRHEDLPQILYSLQLRDLCGIGANMEARLHQKGIFYMEKLCSLDLTQMRKVWGSVEGERMWYQLRGVALPDRVTHKRSLGHSQVLAPELREVAKARLVGRRLTAKAASRLRRMGYVASRMSLSVSLESGEYFESSLKCGRVSDSLTLLSYFNALWKEIIAQIGPAKIKKTGVSFADLEVKGQEQVEFFTDVKKAKGEKISLVLDQINQKYGKDSVSLGIVSENAKDFADTKIAFTRIPDEEEFSE